MLSLQRVTDANVTEVLHLHTKPEQAGFIESMEQCMCDAGKYDGWRPTAIYDDETIVGFAMYGYCESENHVWLDRFMIGEQYQGHHLGSEALKLIIDTLKRDYNCGEIYLSMFSGNDTAQHIYEKQGFRFNGGIDINGELIMVLRLNEFH